MRRKVAGWFRRMAERLDPTPPTLTDALMPLARDLVRKVNDNGHAGSVKWLLVMKSMERTTKAKRRHINAAIDRAVLELHGD